MTDVWVTGVGAVTCHGVGAAALWSAMAAAVPRPPTRPEDPHADVSGSLIHGVSDVDTGVAGAGRVSRFAVAAAREALHGAGLFDAFPVRSRVGVAVGSCMGEAMFNERGRMAGGWRPTFQVASAVGDALGAFGINVSVSNACAAGGFALGLAADVIRAGDADAMVVGGADGYSRVGWACFARLGAVDPVRCRPFDRHRRGTVLGEGAGMLVLESQRHAQARGARPYARLTGSGWSCDAHHATAPEPGGRQIARAMREALDTAGTAPDRLGCVVPHGTGTRLNDLVESRALGATLRDPGTPLYSLKALIGHTGGAAAALGAVAAALILRCNTVPPNVPLDELDPQCPVYLPQQETTELAYPRVLVNAYAFGGNNVSLAFEGCGAL